MLGGGENSFVLGSLRARDWPTSFRKLSLDFKKTTTGSELDLPPPAIPLVIISSER
jgi:hypothetical protein